MDTVAAPDTHGTIAGVDGCRAGWVVVAMDLLGRPTEPAGRIAANAKELVDITTQCHCVVIDIPIGFLKVGQAGGRHADRAARQLLKPRGSTVYPAPPRAVLAARSYGEAKQLAAQHSSHGKALSRQAFALLPI